MAEQAGSSGGKRESIFTRRHGSRCLSTAPAFDEKTDKESSKKGNIFNSTRRFSQRNPSSEIRAKVTEDFEYDVKPPRAFYNHDDQQDAFDIHDVHAPEDNSVDTPSLEFIRLAKGLMTSKLVPRQELASIVEDGGVRKRILLEGLPNTDSASTVTDGCRVWIHYEMYVDKGDALDLLDSTTQHGLATSLEVGQDGLPGLYHGVKSMKKREIAEFSLEPEYGYGKRGIPFFIEGDQSLRVILQLVDIAPKTRKSFAFMSPMERRHMCKSMSLEQILQDVEKLIKAGNAKFEQLLYRDACHRYNWALDMLQEFRGGKQSDFTPEDETIDTKSYQLYSNLALCYNRLEDYEETVKACKTALELVHPKWELKPKVLHRYAKAMYHLKKFDEAEKLCNRGLRCYSKGNEFQTLMRQISTARLAKEQEPESDGDNPADDASVELDPSIENDFDYDDESHFGEFGAAFKKFSLADELTRSG